MHPTLQKEVMGRVGVMRSVAKGLKEGAIDGLEGQGCQHWAGLSLRTLAWAYGIVTSRSVRLDEAESGPGVLLPLIDLANHDFSPTAEIRRQDRSSGAIAAGSACLVAAQPLRGGTCSGCKRGTEQLGRVSSSVAPWAHAYGMRCCWSEPASQRLRIQDL